MAGTSGNIILIFLPQVQQRCHFFRGSLYWKSPFFYFIHQWCWCLTSLGNPVKQMHYFGVFWVHGIYSIMNYYNYILKNICQTTKNQMCDVLICMIFKIIWFSDLPNNYHNCKTVVMSKGMISRCLQNPDMARNISDLFCRQEQQLLQSLSFVFYILHNKEF